MMLSLGLVLLAIATAAWTAFWLGAFYGEWRARPRPEKLYIVRVPLETRERRSRGAADTMRSEEK